MQFVPITKKEFANRHRCNLIKVQEDFLQSGFNRVEWIDYPHRTALAAYKSLKISVNRTTKYPIEVHYCDGHVYLARRDSKNED